MMHPTRFHQVLEPAHKLVFGSGYTWPEFHYGARQWWLAGLAAAVMWMSEAVGAGEPRIYLPAIELVFCALSLLGALRDVPVRNAGLRRTHGPPRTGRRRRVVRAGGARAQTDDGVRGRRAAVAVDGSRSKEGRGADEPRSMVGKRARRRDGGTAHAIRTVAAAMLCIVAWRSRAGRRWVLAGSLAALAIAVGAVDGWIWDGTPFHSYLTNARWNLAMPRPGETPAWLILVPGRGCQPGSRAGHAGRRVRETEAVRMDRARSRDGDRPAPGAGTQGVPVLLHSHPLWLVVGADVLARARRPMRRVAGASFALLSAAGLMEMLPLHKEVWRSTHTPGAVEITFKDTDPVITLYRWLRTQENLEGIWHRERKAVTLNGWSLLHRAVPWYDESQGRARRLTRAAHGQANTSRTSSRAIQDGR